MKFKQYKYNLFITHGPELLTVKLQAQGDEDAWNYWQALSTTPAYKECSLYKIERKGE